MIITITGKPCSGKSTVAKMIEEQFSFKRIGVGDMFKQEAKKRGMSAEEFNALCLSDPSYDFFIDKKTAEMGKELEGQNIIFDSRLAWHFVPKSFKVFVDLEQDEMANRLVLSDREGKEKYDNFEDAKRTLLNREKLERERYKKIYGVDIYDTNNFDFVTDSNNKTPQQVVDEIWNAYQKFLKKSEENQKKRKTNKQEKVSIITAVYNVENYLEKCVKSVLNQTYKNIEHILVAQESSDKSVELCEKFAKQHKTIKVIHVKEGSVPKNWNIGLDNATGEYIAFVDSDDYIDEQYIEKMYNALKKHNADIAVCKNYINFLCQNGESEIKDDENCSPLESEKYYEFKDNVYAFFGENRSRHTSWCKLYRKEIFEKLRYPEDCLVAEDTYVIYDLCKLAKRGIVVIPDKLLYYTIRKDNISRTISAKRIFWITAKRHLCECIDKDLDIYNIVCKQLFTAYKTLYIQFKSAKRRDLINKLCKMLKVDWKKYKKYIDKKTRIKTWFFKNFKPLYYVLKSIKERNKKS